MLTEVAEQKKHYGRKYSPDQWKALFMSACGHELQFLPALDNNTFVPYSNHSSSRLSKREMTELIEFILSWAAQNGVQFRDQQDADRAAAI